MMLSGGEPGRGCGVALGATRAAFGSHLYRLADCHWGSEPLGQSGTCCRDGASSRGLGWVSLRRRGSAKAGSTWRLQDLEQRGLGDLTIGQVTLAGVRIEVTVLTDVTHRPETVDGDLAGALAGVPK